ncbi:MAG TPA: hypothetical protein EYQ33_01135 [Gammaproteobacteria bacterium]|nr:hypothetical protein [Gammaproteobacteria bacterium]
MERTRRAACAESDHFGRTGDGHATRQGRYQTGGVHRCPARRRTSKPHPRAGPGHRYWQTKVGLVY